jgi:hypothetical protein
MVRAADPINLRRTSQRPEQGKWGHERDASPCGRVQNHLAMAQCNSAIDTWTSHWNDDPHPFVWTKPANDIITKVLRGRAQLDRVNESATHH